MSDEKLKELAADCARSAAPVFERHGWEYGRNEGKERFVPDDNPEGCWISSGRFHISAETEDGILSYGVMLDLGEVTEPARA